MNYNILANPQFHTSYNNYIEEQWILGWWYYSDKLYPDEQRDIYKIIKGYYWDLVYTTNAVSIGLEELERIRKILTSSLYPIKITRYKITNFIRRTNYGGRNIITWSKKSGEIFKNIAEYQERSGSINEFDYTNPYYILDPVEYRTTRYKERWVTKYIAVEDDSLYEQIKLERLRTKHAKYVWKPKKKNL